MAKLKPEDIEYLAFEGGGGKGYAFLGALEILKHKQIFGIVNNRLVGLKGVAGASAGAITALYLACGFGPADIKEELKNNDFSKFFEKPEPGRRPGIYGVKKLTDKPTLTQDTNTSWRPGQSPPPAPPSPLQLAVIELLAPILSPAMTSAVTTAEAAETLVADVGVALRILGPAVSAHLSPPFNSLLRDTPTTLACLNQDFGAFAGDQFTAYFDSVIQKSTKKIIGKAIPNMTFDAFESTFGVVLAVMGTNLRSLKSILFCGKTTPKIPVAAAVRISMSLPMLFKPIMFKDDGNDEEIHRIGKRDATPPEIPLEDYLGVWIDGGLLNNIPLRVFDDNMAGPTVARPGTRSRSPQSPRFRTLGLRLGIEKPYEINNIWDFLHQWPLIIGLKGTGEARMNRSLSTEDRTIILDTEGLSLLNFKEPSPDIAKRIQKSSRNAVIDYFKNA